MLEKSCNAISFYTANKDKFNLNPYHTLSVRVGSEDSNFYGGPGECFPGPGKF